MQFSSRVLVLLAGVAVVTQLGLLAQPVQAQGLPQLLDSCATQVQKTVKVNGVDTLVNATPGLDCVLQQFLTVAKFILAITGSVALVIFVYTGFMYILYSSQADKAKHYTEGLKSAAIGIVIIFCSGLAVSYFDSAIRGKNNQDCLNLGAEYSCTEKTENLDCIPNLCAGAASSTVQCCKKKTPIISNPDTAPSAANGPQDSTNTKCQELAQSTAYTCKVQSGDDVCLPGDLSLCEVPFQSCCRPANVCDCKCDNGIRITDATSQDECMTKCFATAAPGETTSGICL